MRAFGNEIGRYGMRDGAIIAPDFRVGRGPSGHALLVLRPESIEA